MRLGDSRRAKSFLDRAVANWRRSADLAQLVHGVSSLGELDRDRGNIEGALESAREVEKLLRGVDGLEQIQRVFWIQHRIYAAVGARAAARRALKKAVTAIIDQSATLQGRLRRKFLTGIGTNRDVMREAEKYGLLLTDRTASETRYSSSDPALRIDQRRRAVLVLIAKGGRSG